jgi:uncharacterized protein YbjT (DUF2867 family)
MSSVQRIAIVGATGYIGGRLVPRLLESGYAVRCLVRSPGKLQDRAWASNSGVEIRRVELSDVAMVARNLGGCHAAFYLVHSMISAGPNYAERDRNLAFAFAAAARQAGVSRIIYLGGLGETGANLSKHLSSRREVENALASTGVPVTVLRAAMIIGSGSASFEILRYLVERLPIMITPKWVSTPCQPIAVRNVLDYLVETLSAPVTSGSVFDIGGPDVLCYRDIMKIMAEELGLRQRWIIPVPVLTPQLTEAAEKLHFQMIRALAALARLVEAGDVLPARVFSSNVLGHSKALAGFRRPLERIVGPLERLGIRDTGQMVTLGGLGRVVLPNTSRWILRTFATSVFVIRMLWRSNGWSFLLADCS